jgi:hypothetical protein
MLEIHVVGVDLSVPVMNQKPTVAYGPGVALNSSMKISV